MVKNKHYRQFLDSGNIETLSEEDIIKALDNIKGNHVKEARSLLITLYYTGARPVEVLNLKAKDIGKDKSYILVKMITAKRGMTRIVYLPYRKGLVKELYKYARGCYPDMLMFYHFRSKHVRFRKIRGEIKKYESITDSLRWHFKKWFNGVTDDPIPPYFLRHNRFTKLAEAGATAEEIRLIKGAKKMDSVTPYLHYSSATGKKIARKMK